MNVKPPICLHLFCQSPCGAGNPPGSPNQPQHIFHRHPYVPFSYKEDVHCQMQHLQISLKEEVTLYLLSRVNRDLLCSAGLLASAEYVRYMTYTLITPDCSRPEFGRSEEQIQREVKNTTINLL